MVYQSSIEGEKNALSINCNLICYRFVGFAYDQVFIIVRIWQIKNADLASFDNLEN